MRPSYKEKQQKDWRWSSSIQRSRHEVALQQQHLLDPQALWDIFSRWFHQGLREILQGLFQAIAREPVGHLRRIFEENEVEKERPSARC